MIDEFIKDTLSVNYMINMKIEDFTKEQLIELSEKAYTNNLLMAIKAEHSNFHQGVLVGLVRRDKARQMYNAKVNGGDKMKLILSCVCCGSTEFERKKLDIINVEEHSYLLHEESKEEQLICKKCGLEDYIDNLVITFR